jgi:hypothetical protein
VTKIVEIHIPLVATPGLPASEYQYPWIFQVDQYIEGLNPSTGAQGYDDGEEFGDDYVFFITGDDDDQLLRVASEVAAQDGVPKGVYAVVTDDQHDMGDGRRVELPIT